MNNLTVIIPSRNRANLEACASVVRLLDPTCDVVVAWDRSNGNDWLAPTADYRVREIETPFVYARSCNAGMMAAGTDDVVLLNDDALLNSPDGFRTLQAASLAHPEYGVIGGVTEVTGQPLQRPRGVGLRDVPRMVCFMCVFIPRSTIDLVGLLDEDFVGYGFEDDEYCLRVRKAGLKIGVHDGCVVDHGSLSSTFRGTTYPSVGFETNRNIFIGKYGSHPL